MKNKTWECSVSYCFKISSAIRKPAHRPNPAKNAAFVAPKSSEPADRDETVAHPNNTTARNCQQTTPANSSRGRDRDAEMECVAWQTAFKLPEANGRVFGNTRSAAKPSHRLVENAIRYHRCQNPSRPTLKEKKFSAQTFLMSPKPGRIAWKNAF